MRRREFLAASAAALGLAALKGTHAAAAEAAGAKQLLELRVYSFASAEKQAKFDEFLQMVAVPAYERAKVFPVGVWKMLQKDNGKMLPNGDSTSLWVLMPYDSAEAMLTLEDKLAADVNYTASGEKMNILNAPPKDPAFTRFESTLMISFDQCPKVERPMSPRETRIMQLRCYESHTQEKHRKKVEMFNKGGEIAIFRRCGMNPVFFGDSLVGTKLPNLTYMLWFNDEAAQKQGWAAFMKDPDWQKISKADEYKDTVSNITNIILRPTKSSQI